MFPRDPALVEALAGRGDETRRQMGRVGNTGEGRGEIGQAAGPRGVYLNRESLDIIKVREKSGIGGVAAHLTRTPGHGEREMGGRVWAWA